MPKAKTPAELSPEDAEALAMSGFPGDGDEFDENAVVDDPDDSEPEADPQAVQLAELQAKNAQLEAQVRDLGSRIPPQPAPIVEEVDWGQEFYADPKSAVEKIKDVVRKELRAEYTQDMGRREFWNKFYQKHPDLETSADLVQSILAANMSSLANKSIPDAIKDLSALTRARIASYIQGQGKNTRRTNRAQAEGAGPPAQRRSAQVEDDAPPQTLGNLIRGRAAKRAKAA